MRATSKTITDTIQAAADECSELLLRIAKAAPECTPIEQATVLLDLTALAKKLKSARYKYPRLPPLDEDDVE